MEILCSYITEEVVLFRGKASFYVSSLLNDLANDSAAAAETRDYALQVLKIRD